MASRFLTLFILAQVGLTVTVDGGLPACTPPVGTLYTGTPYLAKFDDLTSLPAGVLPQLEENVGNYKGLGLSYDLRVANVNNSLDLSILAPFFPSIPKQKLIIAIDSVAPESSPNIIGAGLVNRNVLNLLTGGNLPPLTAQSHITIGDKDIKEFDLNSVFAAIIAFLPTGGVSLPSGGSLSVYGDCWNEKTRAYAQTTTEPVNYSPDKPLNANMLFYEFKNLKRCRSVTFGVAESFTGAALVIVLDNVDACLWKK